MMIDQTVTHGGMKIDHKTVLGVEVDVIEHVRLDNGRFKVSRWEVAKTGHWARVEPPYSGEQVNSPSYVVDSDGNPVAVLASSTQSAAAAVANATKRLKDGILIRENRDAAEAATRTLTTPEFAALPYCHSTVEIGSLVAVLASGRHRAGVVVAKGRARVTVAYHIASSGAVRLLNEKYGPLVRVIRQAEPVSDPLLDIVAEADTAQASPAAEPAAAERPSFAERLAAVLPDGDPLDDLVVPDNAKARPLRALLETLHHYGAAWAWEGDPSAEALARMRRAVRQPGSGSAVCWRYVPGADEIAVGDLVTLAAGYPRPGDGTLRDREVVRVVDRIGRPWEPIRQFPDVEAEYAWVILPRDPHGGRWVPVSKLRRLARLPFGPGDTVRRVLAGTSAHLATAEVARFDEELSANGSVMMWVRWSSGPHDGLVHLVNTEAWEVVERAWPPVVGARQLRNPGADDDLHAALVERIPDGVHWEDPIPWDDGTEPVANYVTGWCGHRVAASEWRAGFRFCERDPDTRAPRELRGEVQA